MTHWDVHYSVIYNRPKLETTQVSISWGLVKLICPYNGLFAVIKNRIIGKNIETWSYYLMRKTS